MSPDAPRVLSRPPVFTPQDRHAAVRLVHAFGPAWRLAVETADDGTEALFFTVSRDGGDQTFFSMTHRGGWVHVMDWRSVEMFGFGGVDDLGGFASVGDALAVIRHRVEAWGSFWTGGAMEEEAAGEPAPAWDIWPA